MRVVSEQWRESASPPRVLGYSLDHTYTLNQCGFDDLKGRDRVVATVMRDAKGEDGSPLFDVRLVVFSLSVRRGSEDREAFCEVVAVTDQDGKEVTTAELEDIMYVGEDGLFRTFEDLSEAQQAKVDQDDNDFDPDYIGEGCFDVVHSMFQRGWSEERVEHHDAGNEGGGRTTWYRSAALVFKPAGDSEW